MSLLSDLSPLALAGIIMFCIAVGIALWYSCWDPPDDPAAPPPRPPEPRFRGAGEKAASHARDIASRYPVYADGTVAAAVVLAREGLRATSYPDSHFVHQPASDHCAAARAVLRAAMGRALAWLEEARRTRPDLSRDDLIANACYEAAGALQREGSRREGRANAAAGGDPGRGDGELMG